MLTIRRAHVDAVVRLLKRKLSPSFRKHIAAVRRNADRIHVVSSGFREYVEPVCAELGIPPERIHCNDFKWKGGVVTGFDASSPLAQPGGKARVVRALKLPGRVVAIGDGVTDAEIRDAGAAHEFVAYCENIERESVVARADRVARTVDEVLWLYRLPGSPSFPKSRMVALLCENIHADAAQALRDEGYRVETLSDALAEAELARALKGVSILGIRSKTRVTAKALESADRLLAVGCFCIGTEQVDLPAAASQGVAVFNAPYSNTRKCAARRSASWATGTSARSSPSSPRPWECTSSTTTWRNGLPSATRASAARSRNFSGSPTWSPCTWTAAPPTAT
jgi:D-3-phosphoglycerate dehydrogenase